MLNVVVLDGTRCLEHPLVPKNEITWLIFKDPRKQAFFDFATSPEFLQDCQSRATTPGGHNPAIIPSSSSSSFLRRTARSQLAYSSRRPTSPPTTSQQSQWLPPALTYVFHNSLILSNCAAHSCSRQLNVLKSIRRYRLSLAAMHVERWAGR